MGWIFHPFLSNSLHVVVKMAFFKPKGTSSIYRPYETRRDVRRLDTKINEELLSPDGGMYLLGTVFVMSAVFVLLPFGGELTLTITMILSSIYMHPERRVHNFPWRVPKHAKLFDGSKNIEQLNNLNKGNVIKHNPKALFGEGVTYYGVCRETGLPVYSTNSDDRTHLTCLGTTGSGKTEFLLGLVANQLVQDSGLIYVDAKGDPSLQREVCRLARRFGRDDDILTINFITSGRDLVKAQSDKVTNTFNVMADTSAGMLIELLNNLLDDSGGSGGDMWKGRAMTFIAAITVALTYLRDKGFLQLSPSTYIRYMELPALEELVFEHEGKYGEQFNIVSEALKNYLITLPGYNDSPKARKKQDQDTKKQHGFIVMQLTRSLNQLTYDYGYIFGAQQGDIDIFDCVLNRRILTIPLPALERAPDSLKMLGKLCIGSVKQMMASSLGNRIEGLIREILDSRATNAPTAFKLIFDEFGYIVISGVSVMPAQGRSLSFSICFAAQDFSDIKRGNEHEAEAIWGNSNVKAIGRIVTGDNGDTMNKVNGVAGEEQQSRATSTQLKVGDFGNSYTMSPDTQFQKEKILPYSDLAGQENGEFTLLISKKEDGGKTAGVKIIRIMSFYVAGQKLKYLRMNDLCPNFSISVDRIKNPNLRIDIVSNILKDVHRKNNIGSNSYVTSVPFFKELERIKNDVYYKEKPIERIKAFLKYELDKAVADEQSFVQLNNSITDIPNIDELTQLDQDNYQVEQSSSINIAESVNKDIIYRSTLEEKIIETNKNPVEKKVEQRVDVKTPLSSKEIESINIFKLLRYADECNERLKRHDIEAIPSKSSYQLLPFVPSYVSQQDESTFDELNIRLKNLESKYVESKDINIDVVNEAEDLFNDISFAIQDITDTEIVNNDTPSSTEENRGKMVRLITLIELSKNQTKFN